MFYTNFNTYAIDISPIICMAPSYIPAIFISNIQQPIPVINKQIIR